MPVRRPVLPSENTSIFRLVAVGMDPKAEQVHWLLFPTEKDLEDWLAEVVKTLPKYNPSLETLQISDSNPPPNTKDGASMPEPPPAYADSVKSNVNSPDMLGQNMAYPGQNYNPSQNYATQPVYPSGGSYAPTGAVYASNPSPQPVSQPTMAPSGGSGNADPGTGSSLSPALTAGLGAGAGALAGSLLGSGIGSYFANRNSGSGGSASRTYGGGYDQPAKTITNVTKNYYFAQSPANAQQQTPRNAFATNTAYPRSSSLQSANNTAPAVTQYRQYPQSTTNTGIPQNQSRPASYAPAPVAQTARPTVPTMAKSSGNMQQPRSGLSMGRVGQRKRR
ncbi:PH domain containing protein [Ditylenchus destructor]|uniref:PH domain containing protein n=1 Tax=Ditylenchus destructor TaxID=166010 RepID=A0AAD4R2H1_9BILA|nr:PH domain containing protein [Ditylenchus destructor]